MSVSPPCRVGTPMCSLGVLTGNLESLQEICTLPECSVGQLQSYRAGLWI
jgi:hypothetical protein